MTFRKKEVALILLSVLFAMASSFILYNVSTIAEYVFKRPFEPFKQVNLARFFSYFLFALFVFPSQLSPNRRLWIIFLPVFIIDATTLIFGQDLLPLRFPFATIYPFLGIYCGVFFAANRLKFISGCIFSVLFMLLSQVYFIPGILRWMHMKNDVSEGKNELLVNNSFLGINKATVSLLDTLKSGPSLIEFYFVGCLPCEQKFHYLKRIYEDYENRNFTLVLICDGKANSYAQFIKHWGKSRYKNIIFLYDADNAISDYEVEGYPTELLTNGEYILKKEKGFGPSLAESWMIREKQLIEKIYSNEKE